MGYNEMLSAMDMEIQTPYFKDAFDKMPEYVKAMMRALLRGLELVTNDGVDDFNRVSIDFNEYVYEVGARRYPFQSVKELAKAALARIFVEFDMWLFGAWIDLWDDDHLYTDKKGRTRIYYMFTKRFASMMLHCKDTVMGEEINPDDYKYPVEIHFIKDGDDEYYVAFLPDFGFSACAAAAGDTEEEAVQNLRDVKKFVI